MPSKFYELRVFKGDRPVRTAQRLLEPLDLADPDGTKDLLTRHLYAAAERDGRSRREAHLYHFDVHEVRGEHVQREWMFQFSIPVGA
ncbi:hypothetical protein [Micromonospora sp. NPDC005174]|uniref:hypothetical protein n=1 Tax=Micromonospora sp. NPDC005174 TaxID=3157018 RepID=UPI0033B7C0BE